MRGWAAGLLFALALCFPVAPLGAEAQSPARVFRIGLLVPNTLAVIAHRLEPFRQALRDLGYVEGENLVVEYRSAQGHPERLPGLAAELERLKVDAIVAGSTLAIRAAKAATRTIPIVMAYAADPVREGLVADPARPDGNVTGLGVPVMEVNGKRLELLTQVVPKATRVAVLLDTSVPIFRTFFREMQGAAMALGVHLSSFEVPGPGGLERALATLAKKRPDALFVFETSLTLRERQRIVDRAARSRLPAMYHAREFVEAGGLMAYGPSFPDLYRRAAFFVDKILKGAKPADLPVEQVTTFELVINLNTARALGLTIPQSVLVRADQVIQ